MYYNNKENKIRKRVYFIFIVRHCVYNFHILSEFLFGKLALKRVISLIQVLHGQRYQDNIQTLQSQGFSQTLANSTAAAALKPIHNR